MAFAKHRRGIATSPRVLVLPKKSEYQRILESGDRRKIRLLKSGHKSFARHLPTHLEHTAAVEAVLRELRAARVEHKVVQLDEYRSEQLTGFYDLVITVGGDGMVLDAARYIRKEAVLGVRSAQSSHGHYCLCGPDNFRETLQSIISGERQPLDLLRLELKVGGRKLPELVLNEVHIVDHMDTNRYFLAIDGDEEVQGSDGVFIGTPSGSTGWMRSYNCAVLPIADRRLQYFVRGLIIPPGQTRKFRQGLLPETSEIRITSKMNNGLIVVDGFGVTYPFPAGKSLVARASKHDLRLFIDSNANDVYVQTDTGRTPT